MKECDEVKKWLGELGGEDMEILEQLSGENLDSGKGKLLRRLVKERGKRAKIKQRKGTEAKKEKERLSISKKKIRNKERQRSRLKRRGFE